MKLRPPVPSVLLLVLASVATGCGDDKADRDSAAPPSDIDRAWSDYEIDPPADDINVWLTATPYLWPEEVCVPTSTLGELPADAELRALEDGTEALCFWDTFNGNVPEGMAFTELSTCEAAWTQGPPWFSRPTRQHGSDDALLDDPAFVAELDWVKEQVYTSGCACCHASSVGSGHTSGFDFDAPGVWTDSMTTAQLAISTGDFPEHSLFGHFAAELNHGFDRTHTLFASTDPERMAAFFRSEFDRRGGTDEDLAKAQGQYDALFGRLSLPVDPCIAPYEGLVDGVLTWNSDTPVRQIYVLEEGADTPAFTPNLDRPEGTLWALYVDPAEAALAPGTVRLDEAPAGTVVMVPEDGVPELISGQVVRLYATPDIMSPAQLDCTVVLP